MNFSDWHKLDDTGKIDLLREEVMAVKRLLQYGVAAAGVVGSMVGSLVTLLAQHYLK